MISQLDKIQWNKIFNYMLGQCSITLHQEPDLYNMIELIKMKGTKCFFVFVFLSFDLPPPGTSSTAHTQATSTHNARALICAKVV